MPEQGARFSTRQRRERRANRAKHSKRFLVLAKAAPDEAVADIDAAITTVKAGATAKFDETIEVAVNLGVDPRHGDQMVRGTVNLPHGTGKSRKVLVFARGDKADQAREAGADEVGAEELIEQIQKGWAGWADYDLLIASPDMMQLLGRVGSVLKQKMPNPKAGTVSADVAGVVKAVKGATRAEFRVEKAGIIHSPIGKASFPVEHLKANLLTLLNALIKAKPGASRGRYIRKVTLSSSMGPGVAVDPIVAFHTAERL